MKGVSTRKVDDLVRAMGASGFSERRLDDLRYPYLWLDAQ